MHIVGTSELAHTNPSPCVSCIAASRWPIRIQTTWSHACLLTHAIRPKAQPCMSLFPPKRPGVCILPSLPRIAQVPPVAIRCHPVCPQCAIHDQQVAQSAFCTTVELASRRGGRHGRGRGVWAWGGISPARKKHKLQPRWGVLISSAFSAVFFFFFFFFAAYEALWLQSPHIKVRCPSVRPREHDRPEIRRDNARRTRIGRIRFFRFLRSRCFFISKRDDRSSIG